MSFATFAYPGTGFRWVIHTAAMLGFAMLVAAPAAEARSVPPGGSIDVTDPLTGVSLADRPELAGIIIFEQTQPFAGDAFFGVLTTRVIREDVGGTLDFYYKVEQPLDSYSIKGFDSFTTDVDFRTDLPGDPLLRGAIGVARSTDGDILNFNFGNGFLFVQTNATQFALTGEGTFPDDSGDSIARVSRIAVPSVIPLPPAVYAGLIGLTMAAGASHWHRRIRTD